MNTTLFAHVRSSANMFSTFFQNQEPAVVINNTQEIFIIDHINICNNHFPQIGQYLCGVLFSPVTVYSGIPDRLSSALLCFLYWHSCLPSIQICVQTPPPSWFPCGYHADGSIFAVEKVLLFFCLLWTHHQSGPTHFWWTNISVCLVPHHFFCAANHVWCMT